MLPTAWDTGNTEKSAILLNTQSAILPAVPGYPTRQPNPSIIHSNSIDTPSPV